jgi:CMP-N-acetylneuraminic acid synthetase
VKRPNNLTAKHNPFRASTHKDRKQESKRVRGSKHKESDMTSKKDRLTDPSEMGIQELMDMLAEHGYTTSALSNEEIVDLAFEIFDGNDYEEEGDPDEIY